MYYHRFHELLESQNVGCVSLDFITNMIIAHEMEFKKTQKNALLVKKNQ